MRALGVSLVWHLSFFLDSMESGFSFLPDLESWGEETYLHRSGRTARFGSVGWMVSLVFEGDEAGRFIAARAQAQWFSGTPSFSIFFLGNKDH